MALRLLASRKLVGAALGSALSVATLVASPVPGDAAVAPRPIQTAAPAASAPIPVKLLGSSVLKFFEAYPDSIPSIAFNNGLLFAADGGDGKGIELWFSDGTPAGTRLVKDHYMITEDSFPDDFVELNGRVYYRAWGNDGQVALWSTDGTTAGTIRHFGPAPVELTRAGDRLYFMAHDSTAGQELWSTDGRTPPKVVKDILPGPRGSVPQNLTSMGDGTVMFDAWTGNVGGERQVWVSDGTSAGTRAVTTAALGSSHDFTRLGGAVVYRTYRSSPRGLHYAWTIPYPVASPVAPTRLKAGLTASSFTTLHGVALFAGASRTSLTDRELWRTDGTVNGTWRVNDINRGAAAGTTGQPLVAIEDRVLMAGATVESGTELWATEGTNRSTTQVIDIAPGSGSSQPKELTAVGHRVAFTAWTSDRGRELWFSNGTAAGTVEVENMSGAADGAYNIIGTAGETVFFVGQDGTGEGLFAVRAPDLSRPPLCQGREATVVLGQGGEPTNGPDVIVGHSEDNVINGLGGDDIICGKGGNDTIQGGAGDDIIDGGEGNDTVNYAASTQPVTVNLAKSGPQDTGTATGTDVIIDIENAAGGSNDDTITGTGGVNEIQGLTGNDTLIGADGDDVLLGGSGEDRLHASLGNDRLNGGAGNDALNGAAGRDDLIGADGDDVLRAAAADDTLTGGPGTDDCDGGTGTDTAATCETRANIP